MGWGGGVWSSGTYAKYLVFGEGGTIKMSNVLFVCIMFSQVYFFSYLGVGGGG